MKAQTTNQKPATVSTKVATVSTKVATSVIADAVSVIADAVSSGDMLPLLYAEKSRKGVAGHHIQSMNTFTAIGIKQIVTKQFPIEERFENTRNNTDEDKSIREISFQVNFTSVDLKKPITTKQKTGQPQLLTPSLSRKKNLTYTNQMYLSANITATALLADGSSRIRTDKISDFRAGGIPCMVGSELDSLHGLSRDTKWNLEEDPNDPGGYFIIKGGEWVVSILENTANNSPRVFKNSYKNEETRLEFLSKPGDAFENSTYAVFKLLTDGNILIEMTVNKNDKIEIPFYVVFRLLGMNRDREVADHIVYGVDGDDQVTRDLMTILGDAFDAANKGFEGLRHVLDSIEIAEFLSKRIEKDQKNIKAMESDENLRKWMIQRVFGLFDRSFFPHIGLTEESRIAKLRFCGYMINQLLSVHLGIIEPTDRDRYGSKRLAAAGTSLAKAFKQDFNFAIVKEIKKQLKKDFKDMPFSQVHLAESVKGAIKADDLERMMTQSITSGNKTITVRKTDIVNRISSQTLYRKNDLNVYSVLNSIDTPSGRTNKQNDRADEMRRVHSSYLGYVCVSQSAESGDKVGMTKQLAVSASVCDASSSSLLKSMLLMDPDVRRNDDVMPAAITYEKLTKVFVNGDWIGCVRESHNVALKYREMRRGDVIHHLTSIVWMPQLRVLQFWTDVGRVHRPLMIVYNNIAEYIAGKRAGKPVKFRQWVKMTEEHLTGLKSGKITIDDLRREKVVEYLSSEEQECAFLAQSVLGLVPDVTMQYTHCDVPQAILGIMALASPTPNCSNTTRVTYFTCHRKQSCGWFALNYPYRMDKGTILQHYCERPLVSTTVDAITYPNGQNTIVALMLHGGQNQEDSITANQGSIDCGLFNASHYTFEKSELAKGEIHGMPDELRTMDVKKSVIKEFLNDGVVREGTIVRENVALIEKVLKLPKANKNYLYTDKTIAYKKKYETAFVEKVINTRNDDDIKTTKVKLRANRPLRVGDKLASRTGNKGVVCSIESRGDMPYCENGMVPDIIVNPHTIPTRRAINQLIECHFAQIAVAQGVFIDMTAFNDLDIEATYALAVKMGKKYGGYHRMYCGKTGMWIDSLCFIGPTTYQRLQKFVVDECQVVRYGPTAPLTHQPLAGKAQDGSLRFGEMETWVVVAQGCGRILHEKFHQDSDGIYLYTCRGCGQRATVNEQYRMFKCKRCRGDADIVASSSCWSSKLLVDELRAMNTRTTMEVEPLLF